MSDLLDDGKAKGNQQQDSHDAGGNQEGCGEPHQVEIEQKAEAGAPPVLHRRSGQALAQVGLRNAEAKSHACEDQPDRLAGKG